MIQGFAAKSEANVICDVQQKKAKKAAKSIVKIVLKIDDSLAEIEKGMCGKRARSKERKVARIIRGFGSGGAFR